MDETVRLNGRDSCSLCALLQTPPNEAKQLSMSTGLGLEELTKQTSVGICTRKVVESYGLH